MNPSRFGLEEQAPGCYGWYGLPEEVLLELKEEPTKEQLIEASIAQIKSYWLAVFNSECTCSYYEGSDSLVVYDYSIALPSSETGNKWQLTSTTGRTDNDTGYSDVDVFDIKESSDFNVVVKALIVHCTESIVDAKLENDAYEFWPS